LSTCVLGRYSGVDSCLVETVFVRCTRLVVD